MIAGGGQLTRRPCCFSADGALLLVPCANTVRLYDCNSGDLVGRLIGHSAEVTSVVALPHAPEQAYTASLDGSIALWDLPSCSSSSSSAPPGSRGGASASWLRTWQVGFPVESLAVTGGRGDETAHVCCRWGDAGAARVLLVHLQTGRVHGSRVKLSRPSALAVDGPRRVVAAIDRRTVLAWRHVGAAVDANVPLQPLRLVHTKHLTCVAVDADGARIAAGDVTGRILTWHDVQAALDQQQQQPSTVASTAAATKQPTSPPSAAPAGAVAGAAGAPPCTTVHWHAHAVGALCFSEDGRQLLSGGQEAVLVLWQVSDGSRRYLPRLGGAVVQVAPRPSDAATFAVAQANNTLRIVNVASVKVERTVAGVLPAPSAAPQPPGSLGLRPGSCHLALPSSNCVLQLYDVVRDRPAASLQAAPRNLVSLTHLGGEQLYQQQQQQGSIGVLAGVAPPPPVEPAVKLLAFGPEGRSMATVDSRPEPSPLASPLLGTPTSVDCIKFWVAAAEAGPEGEQGGQQAAAGGVPPYELESEVDCPHRYGVSSCSYHPTSDLVATTSEGGGGGSSSGAGGSGGELHLWARSRGRPSGSEAGAGVAHSAHHYWRRVAAAAYKGLPMHSSCFSDDGSLLAAGCPGLVALWRCPDLSPAGLLHLPGQGAVPTHLAVVPETTYLVAVCAGLQPCVAVFDLLTASLVWSVPATATALAVDPVHRVFAIAAQPTGSTVPVTAAPGVPTQQQEQQRDGRQRAAPGGHVLVLDPSEPRVRYAWRLPAGESAPGLFFLAPGGEVHAAGRRAGPAGCCPLLIVTSDRRYGVAPDAEADLEALSMQQQQQQVAAAHQAVADGPSAVLRRVSKAVGGLSQDVGASKRAGVAAAATAPATLAGRQQRVAALFDSPSHALPPLPQLSADFLEALLLVDAPPSS